MAEPSGLVAYCTLPAATALALALSCATLAASLSAVPAATPVIWRNWPLAASPTDTAACVLVVALMAACCCAVVPPGMYPATPAAVDATEFAPSATPPLCCTTAPKPMAVPLETFCAWLSGVPPASALLPRATPPPPAREFSPMACEPVASEPVPIAMALAPVACAPKPMATAPLAVAFAPLPAAKELSPLATDRGPIATDSWPLALESAAVELAWKYLVPSL